MFTTYKSHTSMLLPRNLRVSYGFTLIELSITLVIIGLLVGGVLAGKDLIEAAKLRSQIKQLQEFEVAFNAFKLKYNCIPGDCINATQIVSSTITNGNGSGSIDYNADAFWVASESSTFFQHLSSANLLNGQYDGTTVLGAGYPRLAYRNNMGMGAGNKMGTGAVHGSYQLSAGPYNATHSVSLYLNIGKPENLSDSGYNDFNGTFSPLEASNLDYKIDDGQARSGRVLGYKVYASSYGNCLDATDGNYLATNTQLACDIEYILQQ